MYVSHMRPSQIQDAVSRNVPVIMAAGVIEYHGPHLPVATDTLIPAGIIAEVEKQCDCVVCPEISYGATLTWAGGPEDGTMDFDSQTAYAYEKEIFKGLLRMGFRRIYVLQFHQGGGEQQLGLMLAARQVIDDITRTWPEGWGRLAPSELPIPTIFSCIQVLGLDAGRGCPWGIEVGHASKGETQLMQYLHPECVDMDALKKEPGPLPAWLMDSHLADVEKAKKDVDFCVQAWIDELRG